MILYLQGGGRDLSRGTREGAKVSLGGESQEDGILQSDYAHDIE